MARFDALTLDQMRILLAVVDNGSFSAAAKATHRAQGAISYNIATMEELVGFTIFDRSGRRASLTPEGKVFVEEVREVLAQFTQLQRRIQPLSEGVETEVALIVDHFLPADVLSAAALRLHEKYPDVRLRINYGILDQIEHSVITGQSDFGISNRPGTMSELVRETLMEVQLIPVASPQHELAQFDGAISRQRLEQHVQISMPLAEGAFFHRDFGLMSKTPWRIDDDMGRLALLEAGCGWARLPEHLVADAIRSGKLVELTTQAALKRRIALSVVYRRSSPPGVVGMWMINALRDACAR